MTTTAAIECVKISNISLFNPPKRIPGNNFQIHIEIQLDGRGETKKKTGKENLDGDRVVWNESIFFSGDVTDSVLTFRVVKTRWLGISYSVGSCQKKVADLLDLENDNGSCRLEIGDTTSQLSFNIELQSSLLLDAVSEAEDASTQIPNTEHLGKIAAVTSSVHDTFLNQEDTWSSLLSQFSIFMTAMDQISEIHPYAKMAWSVLSAIPKTIVAVEGRNDSIKQLVEKIKDTYDFITDTKRLPELRATQTNTLSKLVQQTIECAYFIQEYSRTSIAKKIWKGMNIDDQVKSFGDVFDRLRGVMAGSVTLETNVTLLRVAVTATETHELILLQELPYEARAGFVSGKRCLPGTRASLIEEIIDWVHHETPERIFVLSGAAGTGKSSIAHTIAKRFKEQNRLGGLFCFSRSYKEMCSSLFSTISREIADGDVSWQKSLIRSIQKKEIRASTDMETQFEELIVKPSKETSTIGPVVIVIDALDESGDPCERQALLDILFGQLSQLPINYRFIFTTRPEQDIESLCQGPTVLCKRMGDISEEDTSLDIQTYVSYRLKRQAKTLDQIQGDWRETLAKRAEGLFQWAEIACRIMDSLYHQPSLTKAWNVCTSGASASLYQLYHNIISSQRDCEYAEFMKDFRLIIGAIITTREPLTTNSLETIFEDNVQDVKSILRPFGSLLVGVHDEFTPIRPLHTSLLDFFQARTLDATNDNKYYVDTSDQSFFMSGCLRLMNRSLCFNICNLETSHIRNRDVPDFSRRVREAIPPHLSYASRFWGLHLQYAQDRKDVIIPQLRILMHEKLLYWFEALGLLGEVEKGLISMRILRSWCQDTDNELVDQAADAIQFGVDFGDVIENSTPHLYLSALPYTPSCSFISKQFSPFYPRLFSIDGGQQFDSIPQTHKLQLVRKTFPLIATYLAFSPDDKYIATGFKNGEFWFWNRESGEILNQWKKIEDEDSVCNIVFSPDGQSVYCCLMSGRIRIWNFKTRETIDDSHLDIVKPEDKCCWCIVSSDGHYITFYTAYGSSLYDRMSRQKLMQFRGHRPIFTPKGDMLAFFDQFDNLCLWDIHKKATVHFWMAVNYHHRFALSDRQIAFKRNKSIQVWDIHTLTMVCKFDITIRSGSIQIFFASDQRLFFHSNSGYVVQDISTGKVVVQSSLYCYIWKLAVSSDTKYVVAVNACEHTLQVVPLGTPIQGRTSDIVGRFGGSLEGLWIRGRYLVQLCYYRSLWERVLILNTVSMISTVFEAKTTCVAVSPRNDHVYVAFVTARGLSVWNDTEGEFILDKYTDHEFLQYSSLGDRLISVNKSSGVINIWDVNTRILIGGPYTVPGYGILALAFSATGDSFVVAYTSRSLMESRVLIEVRACQSGHVINGPFIPVNTYRNPFVMNAISLSAEETKIILMTYSNIETLNAATGNSEINQQNFIENVPARRRLSPNSQYIGRCLTDQNMVELWDIDNQVILHQLLPNGHVEDVFFSDDSVHIITLYSIDHRYYIDIWDISTGKADRHGIQLCSTDRQHMSLNGNYLILSNGCTPKIMNLNIHQVVSSFYEYHRNNSQFGMLPIDNSEARREIQTLNLPSRDEDILEYALMAWDKALFSMGAEISEDGWLLGPHGELLVWIPQERRASLWRPCMTSMGTELFTKLKFDNFVHGTRWMECKGYL